MPERIDLTGDTRLSELLTTYPELEDKLPDIHERFELLKTPLGRIMRKTVTISDMSKRSGISQQLLIERLEMLLDK